MSNILILRAIQQINLWGMFVGIGFLFYLNQWYYYLAAVVAVLLITKFGASIGQHRYFSHRSFTTTLFKEKVLAWLATLSTTGTILQYSTVHRYHHAHSDLENDLHSPYDIGWWRSWFHWYEKEPSKLVGVSYIKDLLKKPHVMWLHKYYFAVIATYCVLLLVIDPWLVLFCYVVPAGYAWFTSGVLSLPLHIKGAGYRNFETTDFSNNSLVWNWLTLGEGLHNNHHYRQHEYNFAFTKKPGEWDICAFLVEKFLINESHNKKTSSV